MSYYAHMQSLEQFGWTPARQDAWRRLGLNDTVPARVVADFGTSLIIVTPQRMKAELSGKLSHYTDREYVPKVGDWVAVRLRDEGPAVVQAMIPRYNEIARKVSGKQSAKQIIAANVDIAFVLLSLDNDFSVERLQRFLYQLTASKTRAVIVLNKADKISDVEPYLAVLQPLALPIVIATATHGSGVAEILSYIKPGDTAILLGSSGVGKSTLTNQLLGRDAQATQEVRASDDTGQHTTVHRELFVLPGGGLLIDTPGVRELQLWGTEEDLNDNFDDIAALVSQCKYTTCRHGNEEGCAVRAALQNGELQASRYKDYLKMKGELATLNEKTIARKRLANKKLKRSSKRV
jgi:ribosome biogenesis GTPase